MAPRLNIRIVIAVLATCLPLQASVRAQSAPSLHSPVILMYDGGMEPGGPSPGDSGNIQMREDGSGFTYLTWPHFPNLLTWDLTHNGVSGRRYLLSASASGVPTPAGYSYADCVSFREDGDPNTFRVLTSGTTTDLDRGCGSGLARWSVDGTRVLYPAQRWVGDTAVERGVYIGEVVLDATGAPTALVNEHPVALDDPENGVTVCCGTLSSDGLRVVFAASQTYIDEAGIKRSRQLGFFITSAPRPTGGVVPGPQSAVPLGITGGAPVFSPAARDNRLVYIVKDTKFPSLSHLRIVTVPPGYDGSSPLQPVQVTAKGLSNTQYAVWSPDGAFLAYTTATFTGGPNLVYKMRSNGSGKAVRLTSEQDDHIVVAWRR